MANLTNRNLALKFHSLVELLAERWRCRGYSRVDLDSFISDQRRRFERLGLDYEVARMRAREIRARIPSSGTDSRSSEHYELFAALLEDRSPRRILEIGTDTGMFAAFCAEASPESWIITVDLESSDRRFRNASSDRGQHASPGSALDPVVTFRDGLLARYRNVERLTMNSLRLIYARDADFNSFDIVWVDGDHHFPTVAIDIASALRLCSPHGIVVVDDIRPDPHASDEWVGPDASLTVMALADEGLCDVNFIHKRIKQKHLVREARRRYIAVLRPREARGVLNTEDA